MVRQTKSKTTESEQAAAPVEVAPKEKKVKVAKAAKVEATPVVAETVVSTEELVVSEEAPLAELSLEFSAKLQQMSLGVSSLKSEFRVLEKKWARELKASQKQNSKHKRKAGNRAPSGFVKPTRISDELAKFLDKPSGTEMARTDVTRDVNKYIRANNLQDKENGRKINPDPKLATLLKLKKTDELTYFNLQKYMSHHFAKAVKDVPVVATA
jgi:chromatin remodeling complex protein RSC6